MHGFKVRNICAGFKDKNTFAGFKDKNFYAGLKIGIVVHGFKDVFVQVSKVAYFSRL